MHSTRYVRGKFLLTRLALGVAPVLLVGCGWMAAPKPTPSPAPKLSGHAITTKKAKAGGPSNKGKQLSGTHSSVTPMNLATLPPLSYLKKFNPGLKHLHRLSGFIPNMGYHWATPFPGIVLMTNKYKQVTAVETSFPQKLGTFPWYDPPTTVPNAGVAINSEHLYFVPPTMITSTMSRTAKTDLTSWARFVQTNPRLKVYVKKPTMFDGMAVYGAPSGPSLEVLVSPDTSTGGSSQKTGTTGKTKVTTTTGGTGTIAGFIAQEPAKWGWHRGYFQPKGKPVPSKLYGKAYYSVVLLIPPKHA